MDDSMKQLCVDISFSALNILLHITCAILLLHVYQKQNASKTQKLALLNLSIAELARNIYVFIGSIMLVTVGKNLIMFCIFRILLLCIYLNYIFAMFFIMADRLAASVLNIRYIIVCTTCKTKTVILCTWFFSFLVTPLIFSVLYARSGSKYVYEAIDNNLPYIGITLQMMFLVFSVTSYTIIFAVFVRSRRRSTLSQQSLFQFFTRSNFYAALLLISTFVVLQGIPGIMWVYMILRQDYNNTLVYFITILLSLSDTVDGIIYILLYSPVRNALLAKTTVFHRRCKRRNRPQTKVLRISM